MQTTPNPSGGGGEGAAVLTAYILLTVINKTPDKVKFALGTLVPVVTILIVDKLKEGDKKLKQFFKDEPFGKENNEFSPPETEKAPGGGESTSDGEGKPPAPAEGEGDSPNPTVTAKDNEAQMTSTQPGKKSKTLTATGKEGETSNDSSGKTISTTDSNNLGDPSRPPNQKPKPTKPTKPSKPSKGSAK